MGERRLHVQDRIAAGVVWLSAVLVTGIFAWILADLFWHGLGRISWEFLTAAPREFGREGGIGPILVSTALILAVCMAVSLPLGLGTAILLSEFTANDGLFGRVV